MTDPFTKAMADIFNTPYIGDDALYIPASGAAIPCRVLVERNVLLQPNSMNAQVTERGITIEAQLSEILTEPKSGDMFIINPDDDRAESFTVESIDENDGITVKAIVT